MNPARAGVVCPYITGRHEETPMSEYFDGGDHGHENYDGNDYDGGHEGYDNNHTDVHVNITVVEIEVDNHYGDDAKYDDDHKDEYKDDEYKGEDQYKDEYKDDEYKDKHADEYKDEYHGDDDKYDYGNEIKEIIDLIGEPIGEVPGEHYGNEGYVRH